MKSYKNIFDKVTSLENLFSAWDEFKRGKRNKMDVMVFERSLEQNIFALHRELRAGTYKHGRYESFQIADPKLRQIHKATVRDRVLHHAVFKILYPIFEPTFIATSFSCRIGKGTHRGVAAVAKMLRSVNRNNTKPCYALKCDVRKFFDSIDQEILLSILSRRIHEFDIRKLLTELVGSYNTSGGSGTGLFQLAPKGIPIGNLTSQLFANIYMNEFDQFVKHDLKVEHYARYTDDFIIVSEDRKYLENLIVPLRDFLEKKLLLSLHPNKVTIRKYSQGIDFLGYVILPHCRIIRARTKKRMIRKFKEKVAGYKSGKIGEENVQASLRSYLGVASHANAHKVEEHLKNLLFLG